MNLSEKVEETFEKLKPHTENQPVKAPESLGNDSVEITEDKKFSLNLEDIRDYLLVLVCFAIALAAIFLLAIPQFRGISTVSLDYDTSQTRLIELRSQREYLKGLVGLEEELEANIELADQALPSTEDRVPYTLDQIVQITETSRVAVESLSLVGISDVAEGSTDNLRPVSIQLSVGGSEEDILQFLYNLENARTIVNIKNFQLGTQSVTVITEAGNDQTSETSSTIEQQSAVLVLESYLKEEAETEVDLSALANSPSYDALFTKLKGMRYYEPSPLNIELGRDNPFDINESTPSFVPSEESPTEETEDDASGIE